jgi:protein-disulfide isomerase
VGKQGRAKTREERKAQAAIAAQRGRRVNWIFAIGGVIIVALVAAIVVTLVRAGDNDEPSASGELVNPKNATATGALQVGQADAPVRLEIYLDYMCPFCGRFERANGPEIARLVDAGTTRVELYPLAFLDETSQGTRYSTRAANAATTVGDRSPDHLLAFNNAMFEDQPEENTEGLSDEQIAERAKSAGVPDDVVAAFPDLTFEPWVAKHTEEAFGAGGIQGTPTVKINGTKFEGDLYTAGPLTEAINAAAKGQ